MKSILSAMVGATLALSGIEAGAQATPGERQVSLTIESTSLATALDKWAQQSGFQIFVQDWEGAKRLTAPSLKGTFSAQAALEQLLKGTQLTYVWLNDRAVSIRKRVPPSVPAALQPSGADERVDLPWLQLANLAAQNERSGGAGDEQSWRLEAGEPQREEGDKEFEEVVVTGTYIHGVDPLSPLIRATRDDISSRGYSRLDQFIQQLPQNFSGGGASQRSNPLPGGGGGEGSNNYAFSSGINLRGLGSNATLVLLNGFRLPQTAYGTAVDISRIPLSAIDRVEILTDGASATYGADAVAGVANIITRERTDGFEVGVRMDAAASSKTPNYGSHAVGGHEWRSGNLVLGFDYEKDHPLYARDRTFAAASMTGDTMLLPIVETSNALLSVRQDITPNVTATVDAIASRRKFSATYNSFGFANRNWGGGDQYGLNAQVNYASGADWSATFAGGISQADDENNAFNSGNEILRDIRYRTSTLLARTDGSLFHTRSGSVRGALGAEVRKEEYRDHSAAQNVDDSRNVRSIYSEVLIPVVAPSSNIPLISALRLSVSARYDRYDDFGSKTNPKFAVQWTPFGNIVFHASYGTSFRAPTLYQLDGGGGQFGYVFDLADPESVNGLRRSLIFDNTGNPNLRPEISRALNVGFTYVPEDKKGFSAEVSYFDIRFRDKVVRLVDYGFLNVIVDAEQFVDYLNLSPTLEEITEALATPNLELVDFNDPPGFTPDEIAAIAHLGVVNAASVHPRGIDTSLAYSWDASIGTFRVQSSATYFIDYEFRFTRTAQVSAGIDRLGQPPRFRSNVEVGLLKSAWNIYVRGNFTKSYRNPIDLSCADPRGCEIDSLMTLDMGVAYSSQPASRRSALSGLTIALDVTNALDKDPPFVGIVDGNFDGSNASPLGRAFAVKVSKKW